MESKVRMIHHAGCKKGEGRKAQEYQAKKPEGDCRTASEQYGDQFSQVLAAYGQTEESYRNQIRTQKLVEYAVNQAAQKDLTEANYKAA